MDRQTWGVGVGSCWGLGGEAGCNEEVSDVNDDVMWPRSLETRSLTKRTRQHLHTERFRINIYTPLPWQRHFHTLMTPFIKMKLKIN